MVVEWTPGVSIALDRRLQPRPLVRYRVIFEGIIREYSLVIAHSEVVNIRHNDNGRRIEVERTDVYRQVGRWVGQSPMFCLADSRKLVPVGCPPIFDLLFFCISGTALNMSNAHM